jgi:hypothetical protein
VRATEPLTKRFDERLSRTGLSTAIAINEAGLVLGAGTVLARMTRDEYGALHLDLKADAPRVFALLAAAYARSVSPDVLRHIDGASEQWRRGDKALANIRLAFARLPRLEDRAGAFRLFHAEILLEQGLSPRALIRALGFDAVAADLTKYDPNQPRVPAGSGRESGRWGNGSGSPSSSDRAQPTRSREAGSRPQSADAFVGPVGSPAVEDSFLADMAPEMVAALARFAARFSIPTAVLGALVIPAPNEGLTAQGTLPDHPDVSYRLDRPTGLLTLSARNRDGHDITIRAQNRNGIFVDVATDTQIGRDFQGDLFLSWDAVAVAIQARGDTSPRAAVNAPTNQKNDEPKICPAPTKDIPHGSSARALDYEDDVHAGVNPLAPLPRGFAVMLINPVTGEAVHFDDCFRYVGDLLDRDMKKVIWPMLKGQPMRRFLPPAVNSQPASWQN